MLPNAQEPICSKQWLGRAIYLILRAFLEESRGRHPLLVLTVHKFHDYSTRDHLLVLVSSADLYTVIL